METVQKSYFHRGGKTPLSGFTIGEYLVDIVQRFPDQEAVVSLPQSKRLTYRELGQCVDQLAMGLMALGFTKGERIGLWSTNNLEWILIQLATARIGIILVNINPAYRKSELAYALKQSEIQGLFIIPHFRSSNYISMLVELLPQLKEKNKQINNAEFPFLRNVILYDPVNPAETKRPYPGLFTWQEIITAGNETPLASFNKLSASLDMDEPINIQFTSGTTGFPKAVVLSHHNILNNACFSAQAMHFTQKDRLCIPVPFYHCFGMVLANLLCVSVAACMVIPAEHFDAIAVLQAVQAERCSAFHGVPTMFIEVLEHADFNHYDLSSLRTGIMAGAPCLPPLMKRVMGDMHIPEILIGYGQTEASPLTHLTTRDDSLQRRTETVGKNLPHQEVKIIHLKTGATLPLGEIGEICFRGYHIMSGYYAQADKTAETIDAHGWLYSGDLGCMDAEGYVRITGRLKEMIIRGGENIYPKEIEAFLFTHPKVAQVAVFGVPDELYGEEVMAWIQLHASETSNEDEMRDFCNQQIAHFKIPRYFIFVENFPMTVTGKLQKYRMREIAIRNLSLNHHAS